MSSDTDPFSDGVLGKAVEALAHLPPDQVQLGVDATASDQGVELEETTDLGKGFFAEGDASWWRKAGWKAAAVFGWRKK